MLVSGRVLNDTEISMMIIKWREICTWNCASGTGWHDFEMNDNHDHDNTIIVTIHIQHIHEDDRWSIDINSKYWNLNIAIAIQKKTPLKVDISKLAKKQSSTSPGSLGPSARWHRESPRHHQALHPGRLTWNLKSWWFVRWFPFQLGDFLVPC